MKLAVTGDQNPCGSDGAVILHREPILLWLRISTEGRDPPSGSFYLEGAPPGALVGAPGYLHYVLDPRAKPRQAMVFGFRAADDSFTLRRRILIVSRLSLVVSVTCLVMAALWLAVATWTLERGLGGILPQLGSAKALVSAAFFATLAAAGVQLARLWQVIWHWERCVGLLLLSGIAAIVPQLLVCRVDNATRSDLELSGDPLITIPARSAAIVPRALAPANWDDERWRTTHYRCVEGGACGRETITEPWWGVLPWVSRVTVGCDLARIADDYEEAWKKQPLCKPDPSFEVEAAVPPAPAAKHADLLRLPFLRSGERVLGPASDALTEYYALKASPAQSDLVLELSGQHRLARSTLYLRRLQVRDEPVAVPALFEGERDRTLLGSARLGGLQIGSLSCMLDEQQELGLGIVSGGRRLKRIMFFRGEQLSSAFDVQRQELAHELPLCQPLAVADTDRLELFVGENWMPSGVKVTLPARLFPRITQVFEPDGRQWGELECPARCEEELCSIHTVAVPTRDTVTSARAEGEAKWTWTGRSDPGGAFGGWFWACEPTPEVTSVRLLREGDKRLFAANTKEARLGALPKRACYFDLYSGVELPPGEARARECPERAQLFLEQHPAPGCAVESSRLCK